MLVEPAHDGVCDAAAPLSAPDAAPRRPKILLFDSGLGGLTVLAAVAAARPDADLVYAADDAGFPYGDWPEAALVSRIVGVVGTLLREHRPDLVVVACNTASTLVLPDLRAAHPDVPFVGTVPAVKPAAALSRSRMVSVLATPGTVKRDYTRALIASFAGDCRVTLVGSTSLAALAERVMAGLVVDDGALAAEIAPCFVAAGAARTDVVVLAILIYAVLGKLADSSVRVLERVFLSWNPAHGAAA